MADNGVRRLADKLIDHLSELDKQMAGEVVHLYELMSHVSIDDMEYIEKRFQELHQERWKRMQEVMECKAAKDVTNRQAHKMTRFLPVDIKPEVRAQLEAELAPDPLDECVCGHEARAHGDDVTFGGHHMCRKCDCDKFEKAKT